MNNIQTIIEDQNSGNLLYESKTVAKISNKIRERQGHYSR